MGRQTRVVEAHVGTVAEPSASGLIHKNGIAGITVTLLQRQDQLLREPGHPCLPVSGREGHDLRVDPYAQLLRHTGLSAGSGRWQPPAAAAPKRWFRQGAR